MRKTEMLKAREVLRLRNETALSIREIGDIVGCGKSTISDILHRAAEVGLEWPCELDDKQLMAILYPVGKRPSAAPEPDMDWICREIKKKGVTLMTLWEEYKEQNPDGLMYTQFCERYRGFKRKNRLEYHREYKAGEVAQVDWAGLKIPYREAASGKNNEACVFVAVLPASSYPFARAYADMTMPNWIDAHNRMLQFWGGVPEKIIADNTKTSTTKSDKFDPVLNRTYREMGRYYGTALVPARPHRPRDKGADENQVKISEQRIIAPLRNMQFFSLEEINEAISIQLDKLIHKKFQKLSASRVDLFNEIEKTALRPLPDKMFEYADWELCKVPYNYHVEIGKKDDKFYYSVPYEYVGKEVWVRSTATVVEIFCDGNRIACHRRNRNKYHRYSTQEDHMPEAHKAVTDWSSERICNWAVKTGPQTERYIRNVLKSRDFPQQSYNACMGIMRLAGRSKRPDVEKACAEAMGSGLFSYKYFSLILKRITTSNDENTSEIIAHKNIRGREAYGRR